ncbi:hypothetical protein GMD78_06980 [Ornithinibacillus sp. L9]|uniref:Uncharacterized protein n=1 Tax=Ornithinibacillus caprae TaxID=2678566 RepID=A0A6N8FHH0_9BACI|nr:hypothetical protein [Ornithinibacillus caprae]MUK88136.1 hypothetical protein [Ornithinibacillus caprae]
MNNFSGTVFSGEFDQQNRYFYLNRVKNLTTASTLSEHQIHQLVNYLEKQSDSCTITVNDQIPILLGQEEVELLLNELEIIKQELQINHS